MRATRICIVSKGFSKGLFRQTAGRGDSNLFPITYYSDTVIGMRAIVKDFPVTSENASMGNPRVKAPGKLLSFPSLEPHGPRTPTDAPKVVTQSRLQEAKALLEQELQLVRRRRELLLEIVADLQAGAELEPGELSFDPELRTVQTVKRATIP